VDLSLYALGKDQPLVRGNEEVEAEGVVGEVANQTRTFFPQKIIEKTIELPDSVLLLAESKDELVVG
jgi:hypothetical protein